MKRLSENGNSAHEVGQKRANRFGLYDMLGNIWEWVNDWWDWNYYQNSPSQDPTGPASGQERVMRGGAWFYGSKSIRVSFRGWFNPAGRMDVSGIRCAREVDVP